MQFTPRLQPQSIGDIFDAAVRLYRTHFTTFFGIVAVVLVPMTIFKLLGLYLWNNISFVDLVQNFLVTNLATGVLAIVISCLYLGQSIEISAAYRQGARYIWRMLVASFALGLLALAIFLPFFLCIVGVVVRSSDSTTLELVSLIGLLMLVPIAWLLTRYVFITQAIVLEQNRPIDALKRSWQLTRNSFWRILMVVVAVSLLTYLLTTIPALLLNWVLTLVGMPNLLSAAQIASIVVTQLGLMLAMPIQLAIYTLLYYDMRVRHEAYDLELLSSQLAGMPRAEQGV